MSEDSFSPSAACGPPGSPHLVDSPCQVYLHAFGATPEGFAKKFPDTVCKQVNRDFK